MHDLELDIQVVDSIFAQLVRWICDQLLNSFTVSFRFLSRGSPGLFACVHSSMAESASEKTF